MGLVRVFWPLITTDGGETTFQTAGETRFVVDCKVKPKALVGQVNRTEFLSFEWDSSAFDYWLWCQELAGTAMREASCGCWRGAASFLF